LKEITTPKSLSVLKETGTFIYLGAHSTEAEIRKNALICFWYPRSRGLHGESETNFYDLFKQIYPKRMVNIRALYYGLVQIIQATQVSAANIMDDILEMRDEDQETKKRKKKTANYLVSLERLLVLAEDKTLFEFKDLVKDLVKCTGKSRSQISREVQKMEKAGFLFVDDSDGPKRKKITLSPEIIREALKIAPKKSIASEKEEDWLA